MFFLNLLVLTNLRDDEPEQTPPPLETTPSAEPDHRGRPIETEPTEIETDPTETAAAGDQPPPPITPPPIDSSDSDDGSDSATDEVIQKQGKEQAEKNARLLRITLDIAVSRLCSWVGEEAPQRYKMSKLEALEYETAATDFFQTANFNVSPALTFMVVNFGIFGTILLRAYSDRKAKKEAKIKEANRAAQIEAHRQKTQQQQEQRAQRQQERQEQEPEQYQRQQPPPPDPTEISEAEARATTEILKGRRNFSVFCISDRKENSKVWDDAILGYYKTNPKNEYMKQSDVLRIGTKPSPYIEKLKIEFFGLDPRGQNKKIRNVLKKVREKYNIVLPKSDDNKIF